VKQDAPEKPFALLVRGIDTFVHFELLDPPASDTAVEDDPVRTKVVNRLERTVATK
jgi:hypothetical protein